MSTAISSMYVSIGGSIAGLSKTFSSAGSIVKGFGSNLPGVNAGLGAITGGVRSFTSALAPMAAALIPIATVGGALAGLKTAFGDVDDIAKLSDRLGFTTESLTALTFAADLSGVSAEQLTGAMEKMLVTFGKAAGGSKTAVAALAAIGLSAEQVAAMSPDAAFIAVAEGLKGITSAAGRAKAATDIFGKAGQKLLPLMLSGAEGIKAAQVEADLLGLSFSRLDAGKVELANDSMTRMGAVFTGVFRKLAVEFAPFIEATAVKLTALGTSGGGVGKTVASAFEWITVAVASTTDYVELLKSGFYAFKGVASVALLGVVKPLELVISGVEWLGKKLGLISDGSTWGAFAQGLTAGITDEADAAFKSAGESFDKFQKGVNAGKATDFFADLKTKADVAGKAIADAAPKGGLLDEDAFAPPAPTKGGGKMLTGLWDGMKRLGGAVDSIFESATNTLAGAFDKAIPEQKAVEIVPQMASVVRAGSAESKAMRFAPPQMSQGKGFSDGLTSTQKQQLAETVKQTAKLTEIARNITSGNLTEATF